MEDYNTDIYEKKGQKKIILVKFFLCIILLMNFGNINFLFRKKKL